MKKKYFLAIIFIMALAVNAQEPFITKWNVNSSSLYVSLPIVGTNNNYTIDFGDGTVLTNQNQAVYHLYAEPGTYVVTVSGDFNQVNFKNYGSYAPKIYEIMQWGDVQWTNMNNAFYGCNHLNITAIDAPDLSQVTNMQYMFSGCSSLNQSLNNWDVSNIRWMGHLFQNCSSFNGYINDWDVSEVQDMQYMFRGATSFNQPLDNWDVANVTNMQYMFKDASSFNSAVNAWDVSEVQNMRYMFQGAISFNQPLNAWDVSEVHNMQYMFNGASSFNQPIGDWDTWYVFDMRNMFKDATSFNQPIDSWDISNVDNIAEMFRGATSFNQSINSWDISDVNIISGMFRGATSFNQPLDNWDFSNTAITNISNMFEGASSFNQPIDSWDVSNITNISEMFRGATSFNQPLNSWDVSNVIYMSSVFRDAISFNQPLDNWDVSNVNSYNSMFYGASSFNQPLNSWNFKATSYYYYFIADTSVDVENYDLLLQRFLELGYSDKSFWATGLEYCNEAVRNALINNLEWNITGDSLSDNCIGSFITTWQIENSGLSITIPIVGTNNNYTVDFGDGTVLNNQIEAVSHTYAEAGVYTVTISGDFNQIKFQDFSTTNAEKLLTIEEWGATQWASMEGAFYGCSNLTIQATDIPDLSSVTTMASMFYGCSSLNQPLNDWDVSNITTMFRMFRGANSFNQPLNSWNISSVIDMSNMFEGAISFNQDISNWNYNSSISLNKFLNESNLSIENYDALLGRFLQLGLQNKTLGAVDLEYCDEITRNLLISSGWTINGDSLSNNCNDTIYFVTTWQIENSDLSITIPIVGTNNNYTVDFGDGTGLNNQIEAVSHTYAEAGVYTVTIFGDFNQIKFQDFSTTNAEKLLTIEEWGTTQWASMEGAFYGCSNLTIPATDTPDLSWVTFMSNMFYGCSSLNQSLNNWDVSNIKYMSGLFSGCSSFNQPLDNWDVSGVLFMNNMFFNTSAFNQSLDNWDVSSVLNMGYMFYKASSFNKPLDNWDVSGVISMKYMFFKAVSFNQLLNSWNVSNVTNMLGMFWYATSFNQPLSNWDFNNNNDFSYFLDKTILNVENYDALLQRFLELELQNKILGADGLEYCDVATRNSLINGFGWTINDDSLNDDCVEPTSIESVMEDQSTQLVNSDVQVVLYPNPTNGIVYIQSIQDVKIKTITVFNLLGEQLLFFTENPENINIGDLSSGVYLLYIRTDKGIMKRRLVKN